MSIMLSNCVIYFGAMLQNSAYYAQIMLHKSTIIVRKFNISFLLNYEIMSISSLPSLAHHLIYLCTGICINTLNFFVAFATLVSTYFNKTITTDTLKSQSYVKNAFYTNFVNYADNFCLLCWNYA